MTTPYRHHDEYKLIVPSNAIRRLPPYRPVPEGWDVVSMLCGQAVHDPVEGRLDRRFLATKVYRGDEWP